jgi:hypothetical protein
MAKNKEEMRQDKIITTKTGYHLDYHPFHNFSFFFISHPSFGRIIQTYHGRKTNGV